MSVTSASTILAPPAGLLVKNGSLVKDSSVSYSGTWALNTATSVPANTATPLANAASQWTLVPALKNANANALLNSSGAFVAPTDGDYTFNMTATTTSTVADFEVWFIYTGAAVTYAPKLGWQKYNVQLYAPTLSTQSSISLYKGDVITPYVYQQNSGNSALTLSTASSAAGASGSTSTYGCIFSVRRDAITN